MARPSGTVTFLFTDIVGSTRRWEADAAVDHIRAVLGDEVFDQHVAKGAAMEPADAVAYARHQIQLAQAELGFLP